MGKRNFHAVEVIALGVQSSETRFGNKRRRGNDYGDWPRIAGWRCNLTGLSQVSNLYFIAYSSQIFVYVPIFPSQELPEKPAIVLTSTPSAPGLRAAINQRDPHAINGLVVQHLGYEEVVAAVRDDGDVDAYLVRHIAEAIASRNGTTQSVHADEVKPFFRENVGDSAWGLAIHSEARLIAVSANSQKVTVFKLGIDQHSDARDLNYDTCADAPPPSVVSPEPVTREVINGTCNIPYISFCNTGDDPEARYLLTTDINGYCRTIDLQHMRTVQKFRFGHPCVPRFEGDFDYINAGWTILFLDTRSFVSENDPLAALGLGDGESLPGLKINSSIWDISSSVKHVERAENFVMRRTAQASRRSRTPSLVASGGEEPEHASISGDAQELLEDAETASLIEDESMEDMSTEDAVVTSTALSEGDSDSDDEVIGVRQFSANEPRCDNFNDLSGSLPCPIFHASVRNVFLLQPSNQRQPGHNPISSPTVGFTDALLQYVQADIAFINRFERLNMHAYIPAIGIVVLASQKGRAIVLSLTKMSKSAKFPSTMRVSGPAERTIYGMRIEHIVPLKAQETRNERPFAPLVGIAAGPMQGTEGLAYEKKRWRLMMMYADHSVLSYEIRRQKLQDPELQFDTVVV